MKPLAVRLGTAAAVAALSLAGLAIPAQADPGGWAVPPDTDSCGPVVDSVRYCTAPDGHLYPELVSAVAGPRPGISGALQVGSTLTVIDGTWDPADATLTHQWLRNDVAIPDATGPTYKLTDADLGKGIGVKTTAAAPSYATTTLQSTKTAPVTAAGAAVPSLVTTSVYMDTFDTNPDWPSRLVIAAGIFRGAPDINLQYQWLRGGVPIPGATARILDPRGLGAEELLSVRVTGHAPGFNPATGTSAQQKVSDFDPFPGTVVTGNTGLGDVLTAVDAPRTGSTRQPTYQWLRDGVAVPEATALTYTITGQDQGHTLVLQSGSWYEAPIYSNAVAVPAAAGAELKQLTNVTKPAVTGTFVTGSPMKVSAGTWSAPADKLTLAYSWFAPDGTVVASGPAFTPDAYQVGKTLTVLVTASAPGYTTARVKVITNTPVTARASTRAISGKLVVGSTATLTRDPWYDRVESDVSWLRDGKQIEGAYGWSYVLTKADAGTKISASVSPVEPGGKYETVNASAKVAGLPLVSSTPTISGTVKPGNVLTVKRGTWSWGTAFTYRWLRNGVPISNAYASTYKVRTADKGTRISVRVTGARFGYTTVTKTSASYAVR